MRARWRLVVLGTALFGLGCGSLPSVRIGLRGGDATPWDAAQVAQLAEELEMVVARAARQSEEQIIEHVGTELEFGEEEVDPAALLGALDDLVYDVPTLAELHVDTPEVAGAVRARQLRAGTLQHWKRRGCMGENAQGKVVSVKCEAAREDPVLGERLAFIVIKENRNRRYIYEQLQNSNRWPNRHMRDIRRAFAAAIRDVAEPTDLFAKGGAWEQKDPTAGRTPEATDSQTQRAAQRRARRRENWEQAEVLDVDVNAVPPRVVPQR